MDSAYSLLLDGRCLLPYKWMVLAPCYLWTMLAPLLLYNLLLFLVPLLHFHVFIAQHIVLIIVFAYKNPLCICILKCAMQVR